MKRNILAPAAQESPIARKRRALNLAQEELARKCGVSRPFVSLLESGRTQPNVQLALKLAAVLESSVEELFGAAPEASESALAVKFVDQPPLEGARLDVARVGKRWVAHPTDTVASLGGGFADADGVFGLRKGIPQLTTFREHEALESNLAIAGCDPALALLRNTGGVTTLPGRCFWVNCGSARALNLLAQGWVHAAGLHYSGAEHAENLRQVQRFDPAGKWQVFRFTQWEQGWLVRKSAKDAFRSAVDLLTHKLRLANREEGSGSRHWLDQQLSLADLPVTRILGYKQEYSSHWECARALQEGLADISAGPRAVANTFGLHFIPVAEVAFDLVVPRTFLDHPRLQALLNRLRSRWFQREIENIPGYTAREAGEVLERVSG